MKLVLRRLEIWNWQGLEHEVLGPLHDGLNLVDGPNESGKSRLRNALDHALLLTHRGRSTRDYLRSKGSRETPRLTLDIEVNGVSYTIEKRFLDRPAAKLSGGGQVWHDEHALKQLAQLLGARSADARAVKPMEAGIWSLLWLRQGESGWTPDAHANSEAASTVQDALARETGAVLAGAVGQGVLDKARLERARFRSENGREANELAAGIAAAVDAEARLRKRREALAEAERCAVEHAATHDRLEQLKDRLASQAIKTKDSQNKARQASDAERQLETARAGARVAELTHSLAAGALARADALQTRTAQLDNERAQLQTSLDDLGKSLQDGEKRLAQVAEEVDSAEQALEAAEDSLGEAEAHEKAEASKEILKQLHDNVVAGRGLISRQAAVRGQLADCLSEASVRPLEALERARVTTAARRDAATPTLVVAAHAELMVNGDALAAGENRVLRSDSVELAGLATVRVPPSAQREQLRDAARDAGQALERALNALGVASLAAAHESLATGQRLEVELAQVQARLEGLLPSGLDEAEVELARLEAADIALPEGAGKTVAEAREQIRELKLTVRDLRGRRDAAAEPVAALAVDVAAGSARLEGLRAEHLRLAGSSQSLPTLDSLRVEVAEAETEVARKDALMKGAERLYSEAGGRSAATEAERAERALGGLEKQQEEARERSTFLAGQLETMGGRNLHEQLQDAEAGAEAAKGKLARLEREDGAARRLVEVLEARHAAARERLVEPILARVAPWLGRIFPNSKLELAGDHQIPQLVTENITEHFQELSGGAREQLGVMVRAAIGQVVAGEGRVPLVLDDALVNTDHERLPEMLAVLDEASADGVQVVVFTCHDVDYDDLGAHYRKTLAKPAIRAGR